MAELITDERLREIAGSHNNVWMSVMTKQVCAELLAARERIAKLEQEPPMTLVDFGYGLDLQGIRDDLKLLNDFRKENQRLRAEVERLNGLLPLLMQLWDAAKEAAGTISMSQEHSCYYTYGFLDKEPALKMIDALEELRLWQNKETP